VGAAQRNENAPARLSTLPTWLLSQAAARSHRLLTTALATAGARGYQYRILAALDESGTASQADLGRVTNLDRSDVNAVIAELVDLGAVTRAADQADRRRNQITLTKTGQDLFRTLDDIIEGVQQQVLAPLSARERLVLTNLLARINP
jgi:DNA-binding MarR family transcriptional regulator